MLIRKVACVWDLILSFLDIKEQEKLQKTTHDAASKAKYTYYSVILTDCLRELSELVNSRIIHLS